MTIQAAIRQARQDLSWNVSPGRDVTVLVRYTDFNGLRKSADFVLNSRNKEAELIQAWLDRHEALEANLDAVDYVRTPDIIQSL